MMRPLLVNCLHAACEAARVPVLDVLRARRSSAVCLARRIGVYLAVESGLAIADIAAGMGRKFARIQHLVLEADRRQQMARAREAGMLAAAKARLGTMMRSGARSALRELPWRRLRALRRDRPAVERAARAARAAVGGLAGLPARRVSAPHG